jgi:peptidoglycan/xylan/chitin deacetylase (PgdA/CDA1 family)
LPVLLYHHLVLAAEGRDENNAAIISAEEFSEQMAWLAEHEYYTPTLEEFRGWLAGETWLPEKSVLITFDDEYDSVEKHAFPVLQHYRLRAVVFVFGTSAGRVGTTRSSLNWDSLKALYSSGLVEVQSHTFDGHGRRLRRSGLRVGMPSESVLTWTG